MSILLTCNPSKSKRCYCALICFGYFWPPNLCLIPDLYAEFPALYSDICVSSSTVPATYVFESPYVVSVQLPRVARAKISKNEVDNLVLYCLNNGCTFLYGPKLRSLSGFKVVRFPKKWVSKLVMLLHFMNILIYKEVHALSYQHHELCGRDGSNWWTL